MEKVVQPMAQRLGGSHDAGRKAAGFESADGRQPVSQSWLAVRWSRFLSSAPLKPGPALVAITLASLVFWAAVIGLVYVLVHR